MYIYIYLWSVKIHIRSNFCLNSSYVLMDPCSNRVSSQRAKLREFGKSKSAVVHPKSSLNRSFQQIPQRSPARWLSTRKNIELDFFTKINWFPLGLFSSPKLWSVEFMGPKYSKQLVPTPRLYTLMMVCYTTPFLDSWEAPILVWQAACGPGKCPSCLVVAMRSRRGHGFTHRKRKKNTV